MATAAKTNGVELDWTALAAATAINSGDSAISSATAFDNSITVRVAHGDGNANALGVLVTVEADFDGTDEGWADLYPPIRMGAGTANIDTMDGGESATDTEILTAGSTFSTIGQKLFVNNSTPADSEIVRVKSVSGATLTIFDGLANAHSTATPIRDGLAEKVFDIPPSVKGVRVVFANEDADAAMVVQVLQSKIDTIA